MAAGATALTRPKRPALKCFNGRLLYAVALIAFSQVNFGMDQAAFANTQAMPFFKQQFGKWNPVDEVWFIEPSFLALLNSLNYIGFAFGLVVGNLTSRRFGRRIAMFAMCWWAIIAAIILITARRREQMLAGRIIAYVYIGMELALVPILQSELVPRRSVASLLEPTSLVFWYIGQLLMSGICRGTSDIQSHNSWRIPLGLFFIIPSLLALGVWWIPESPRWLLVRDRTEEARKSLTLLRQGAFTEEEIELEFQEVQHSLTVVVDNSRFKELFLGTNLKRTLISVGVNIFLQLTGQNFASVYGTIFIQSIGTINPFTMNTINIAVNIATVLISQALTDKVGRVPLLVAGATIQMGALMTMGGLGTVSDPSHSIKTGIIAMMTIFGVGFSLGWAPLSHVVAAEVPTNRLRDMTYALGSVFNIAIQFAVSYSIPYLLNEPYAALGSKVGFIFGSTAFLAVVFSFFGIPECSGKTLEEIDRLFVEGVPVKDFKKHKNIDHEEMVDTKLVEKLAKDQEVTTVEDIRSA